jgi:hypothetical protein
MGGVVKYLSLTRVVGEMTNLSYIFGTIAVVVGLWQ